MKKIIFLISACVFIPAGLHAQENLKKAFDDFLTSKSNSEYIRTNIFSEGIDGNEGVQTYYYSHVFDMPTSKDKEIDKLRNAFNKDINKAYKVMVRSAESYSINQIKVAYGARNQKNVLFGTHSNRNYMVMLVRDTRDSLMRYSYGLVWYVDKSKNRLCGSLNIIYGKDPAREEQMRYQKMGLTQNDIEVTNVGTDANGTIIKTYTSSISSDVDFLQRFGNLTSLYKDKVRNIVTEESLVIGITNKILSLCRNYGYLLSKGEKEMCIETLKELPQPYGNKFIKGILKESVVALKESKNEENKIKNNIVNRTVKIINKSLKEWE